MDNDPLLVRWGRGGGGPTLGEKLDRALGGTRRHDLERILQWVPQPLAPEDRRRFVRRGGRPTPIGVASCPTRGRKPDAEGLVLDRSEGGLCFASHRPYDLGTELYVRGEAAPDVCPWVGIAVRHCGDYGEFFLVGCEFRQRHPWGVLCQFG